MSPEALTTERVYREIKGQLMTGTFRPGFQIIVHQLADKFGTSISPVRDALQRLVGEKLVQIYGKGGFVVPDIHIEQIYHLYAWQGDLLRLALAQWGLTTAQVGDVPDLEEPTGQVAGQFLADRAAELFARIGACSPNPEHLHAIIATGERLAIVRSHEIRLDRAEDELHTLWFVASSGDKNALKTALNRYHRRRLSNVRKLCEAANAIRNRQAL
ncbi:regulatory protein GntR, HTH [Sphingobium indicum BiD32]|uniref:Regulatory protein GntR, HTH n=1 Tax=Sphingobium indicum BiD32 TaxID=1301087 RepID=N1MSG6_9SPHN|nr:GntR family transcriptional regulator [Sphingobium indicum]CCW19659.1 regulatory protein GntR, HTH [Sphingobium indicum BiD32]